ncbi:MAG: ABC transporter permease, partial [Clostridia bacterium]|nr:ABC transporter permease [Clostridia bacterium]
FSVPYTSRMASSDNTSVPARIVVCSEEIAEYLDVNYIWGSPPEDGEIAVPANVYRSYGYLTAGDVNDLYFTASDMTYFPLRISGIFEYNNHSAGYAFVTAATAAAIDAETGAAEKFDTYITCKNPSNRYVAQVVENLVKEYRIGGTAEQSRRGTEKSTILNREKIWADYINQDYLKLVVAQDVTPTVLLSMPIILIAALMMASFMTNWTARNSPEYGILGAIGANRRHLCTIAAGQILLISAAASVPVILFSAVISNAYIRVYNMSVTDVGFMFRIPWGNLIQAALWFDVFSCLFTYIGISGLTLQAPFVLISGSYRSNLPFIKISSRKLETSRHKVFHISLLRSLREIRMQILPAVITSLVCIVCGAFLVFQVVLHMISAGQLEVYGQYCYDAGVKKAIQVNNLRESAPFDREAVEMIEAFDMVEPGGIYSYISMKREHHDTGYIGYGAFLFLDEMDVPEIVRQAEVRNSKYGDGYPFEAIVCDSATLSLLYTDVWEGNPEDLLTSQNSLVFIADAPPNDNSGVRAGDTILVTGQHEFLNYTKTSKLHEEPLEFTVTAVASGSDRYKEVALTRGGTVLMSEESAVNLGLINEGEYERYFFNFKEGTSMEEQLAFYDVLRNTPKFLRY